MAKRKPQSTPVTTGVLTAEQFKELSPEAQAEYLEVLNARNAELAAANTKLAKEASDAKKGKLTLPTIEVPADDNSGVEPGTYQWTAPSLTWDDGKVYKVADLMADIESEDQKVSQKAQVMIAKLLQMQSGLLVRKED